MGNPCAASRLTEAQRQLVSDHIWLVELHLRRKVRELRATCTGIGRDDLYQEGCLALIDAARRFDPGQGVPFRAYALPKIHGAVSRALEEDAAAGRRTSQWHSADVGAGACGASREGRRIVGRPRSACSARGAVGDDDGVAVETIGERFRAIYDQMIRRAVEVQTLGKRRRPGRRKLLELLASDRLLVPNEEYRASLREIARQSGSSTARAVRADRELRERAAELLSADVAAQRLREQAKRHMFGMDSPIELELHHELGRLAQRKCVEAFRNLRPELRGQMVIRLVERSGRDVNDFVIGLFDDLPHDQQDALLSELRLAG